VRHGRDRADHHADIRDVCRAGVQIVVEHLAAVDVDPEEMPGAPIDTGPLTHV